MNERKPIQATGEDAVIFGSLCNKSISTSPQDAKKWRQQLVQRANEFAAKDGLRGEELYGLIRILSKGQLDEYEINHIRKEAEDAAVAGDKPIDWKPKFHTGAELETGDVKMYIDRIMPEGVTFIASLSAVGKTWFALSMARALTTGSPFMNVFSVAEKIPVIYLVPEMGQRAVRKRLELLRVPMNEMFFCQTVSDGVCSLTDEYLASAIKELKPVVFLDTAVRFNPSADENSARQNATLLANDLFRFRRLGAPAVVGLHHSPKYSKEAEVMTLENMLRGTGDMGAMCDAVWGLQHDKRRADNGQWDYAYIAQSEELTRLYVACLKPRDFDPAPPFRIQGRPHINDHGDFAVLDEGGPELAEQIIGAITQNPAVTVRYLTDKFKIHYRKLVRLTAEAGWQQHLGRWRRGDETQARRRRDQGAIHFTDPQAANGSGANGHGPNGQETDTEDNPPF